MIRFELVTRPSSALKKGDMERIQSVMSRFTRHASRVVISLSFVTEAKMKSLNRQYMKKNQPTDVLSFNAAPSKGFPMVGEERYLGDLVVCPAYAIREAKRRSVPPREELARLLIHGILHLSGYDHATPSQEARMFRLQERLLEKTGL